MFYVTVGSLITNNKDTYGKADTIRPMSAVIKQKMPINLEMM